MLRYLIQRLLQGIPTLLALTMLSFGLLHVVPGGPAVVMLGNQATPQLIAQINASLGLNKPLYVQYGIWLNHLLHGDLGYAYSYHQSVVSLIALNLPRTLLLVVTAILVSHVLSITIGVYQAIHPRSPADYLLTVLTYVFYCLPGFWLAVIVISVFAIDLGWLPSGGLSNPTAVQLTVLSYVRHMILPDLVLIIGTVAGWARYMRGSMGETMIRDFIRTARAKGVSEPRVLIVHALRNSIIPLITLAGFSLPALFSGSLIVEMVFNYPGVGLLFWNAAQQRDYPILMGIVLMVGALTIAGNFLADVLYTLVDPRIRMS